MSKLGSLQPYAGGSWGRIYHGDCLEVLRTFPEQYFSAVVTDPP